MSLTDYIHLIKPRIIPLLLLVALASAFIAERGMPPYIKLVGLLVSGTLASGGALGLNSYLEMDIDARMRRTRKRPLPSGRIVPPRKALTFSLTLLVTGIAVAYFTLPYISAFFVALGAFIYVPIYTIWLKPRTIWNIVLGGFAGSCAALAGWYAVTTSYWEVAALLAALVFVWTPSHFWSLAVITEEDYSAVGMPMLPSVVGVAKASKAIVFNTLLLIPVSLLLYPYFRGAGSLIYILSAMLFGAFLLYTNVKLYREPTKSNAWLAFKFSSPYLAVIFIIAVIAALV
ncbi:MAG: heme o synthase [Conexivisphaerales archaeon]